MAGSYEPRLLVGPMLTVSRKEGERILVGDSIVIEIVEIRGSRVRVRIVAPRSVSILREELIESQSNANNFGIISDGSGRDYAALASARGGSRRRRSRDDRRHSKGQADER
ncbi:MAG: carbon storage regulator [Desulfurellales bacterium]|nr:MAG: carbon storage regulator [Desulfurellales bacterium]